MIKEKIISKIKILPKNSLEKLLALFEPVAFKKGDLIIKENSFPDSIYFIEKGLARGFANYLDSEITFWLGHEGEPILGMKTLVNNQKCYENIEALEDIIGYKISFKVLSELYNNDIHIANWGRKFAEIELLKTEERLLARQVKTATERYYDLCALHPQLIKRVPLGYIASYLGITQVSLSRIRAEIK